MHRWSSLVSALDHVLDEVERDEARLSGVCVIAATRSQQIVVRRHETLGMDWVEFRCPLPFDGDPPAASDALRLNAQLSIGALCADSDGALHLRHQTPTDGLTPERIVDLTRRLCVTASSLRQQPYQGGA